MTCTFVVIMNRNGVVAHENSRLGSNKQCTINNNKECSYISVHIVKNNCLVLGLIYTERQRKRKRSKNHPKRSKCLAANIKENFRYRYRST